MRQSKYTREQVEPLVKTSKNYYELAQALGMGMKGYHSRTLKLTRRLGLDTSHFTRKPYVSSTARYGLPGRLGKGMSWVDLLILHPVGTNISGERLRRALLWSGREYKCEVCGLLPEWHGLELRLQVDHINGYGWDDRPDNLRFICPNCHSQTPTFCGRNVPKLGGKAPRQARHNSYKGIFARLTGTRGSVTSPIPDP